MSKLAPMLHHHVSMPCTKTYYTLEDMKQGQAELRALLAVARRARMECNCKPADNCAMQRALARLDKASGTDF